MTAGQPGDRAQALIDAVLGGSPAETVTFNLGRRVACDGCDTDLTSDPRSGGLLFGSYAYGPCCADRQLERIRGYGEERYIRARCPEGVAFADWVRDTLRDGADGYITIHAAATKD